MPGVVGGLRTLVRKCVTECVMESARLNVSADLLLSASKQRICGSLKIDCTAERSSCDCYYADQKYIRIDRLTYEDISGNNAGDF